MLLVKQRSDLLLIIESFISIVLGFELYEAHYEIYKYPPFNMYAGVHVYGYIIIQVPGCRTPCWRSVRHTEDISRS